MFPLDGLNLGIALILVWIALFVVTLVLLRVCPPNPAGGASGTAWPSLASQED